MLKQFLRPRDILMDLARCRDRDLIAIVVSVRLVYVLYTLFCTHILPVLFFLPRKFLVFDSGEWLYDDDRFTGMRNWDGVHFFHIAKYGYSHENIHVFFPLVPLLIRGVSFVTVDLFPFLHWLAPVSCYVCMINMGAFACAGVLLRRLTLLTLLGPEAHDLVTRLRVYEWGNKRKATSSTEAAQLEAAVEYRVEHNLAGTIMDSFPSVHAIVAANEARGGVGSGGSGRTSKEGSTPAKGGYNSAAQLVDMLWRATGAAVLCWVVTPSMIFTVAVYTESCFSFFTFAGIYLLAWYPAAIGKDARCRIFPFPASTSHEAPPHTRHEDLPGQASTVPPIRWKQAYTSKHELAAVVCFTIAALSRSNAFVCGGFLLYPTFIRICFPALYRRRWSCIHGAYCNHSPHPREEKETSRAANPSSSTPCTVRTLHPPHGRFPNALRLLVLLLEVAVMLVPYVVITYHGWKTYVPHWTPAEQAAIGNKFWKFYGMLQKKYWNVGFLTAYTIVNSPNVVISAPIGFVIVYCSFHFYVKPALAARQRRLSWQPPSGKAAATALRKHAGGKPSLLARATTAMEYGESFVLSANVVYLWILGLIAFTLMHVQVANRFLMSSPALYWLSGFQLTMKPRSLVSKTILLFSIVWALVGGMLFPNHLPWT